MIPRAPNAGTDVHYDIVRLQEPNGFSSTSGDVVFESKLAVHEGPGSVTATLEEVGGELTYDDPLPFGSARTVRWTPGRAITEGEMGTVNPKVPAVPSWVGERGYIVNRLPAGAGKVIGQFRLAALGVYYATGAVEYTREVYRGPTLDNLCSQFTHVSSGYVPDRIEGKVFGRRTNIRDLRTPTAGGQSLISIVYDGSPHAGIDGKALWLGASVLAGQMLQPLVVESYDAGGKLLSRAYQIGVQRSSVADPPFHLAYAPFKAQWLEDLVDRIAASLNSNFPIDVLIALLHDATDGAMERRMQTYLLAIHTASEAWNRQVGKTTIIGKKRWDNWVPWISYVPELLARWVNADLAKAVVAKIRDANYTSMNARMRSFCESMGIAYAGEDKKAVNLRNTLFHNGYLTRRFETLSQTEKQERIDQIDRLRDFAYRTMFASLGFAQPFYGAMHPLEPIPVQNAATEPNGQAARY